jgi:RNase P/RNase MRP subunit p30
MEERTAPTTQTIAATSKQVSEQMSKPVDGRTDIVFPHGNEQTLADAAHHLGVTHLICCYELSDPIIKQRAAEVAKLARDGMTTELAALVRDQQAVARARQLTKTVIALPRPELFEDKRVTHVIDFEGGSRDDFIHHRNSGLTQVHINNAIRTDKTLVVDLRQLLFAAIPQPVVLGRILQNNTFFRKYKPHVLVASCAREPLELRAPRDRQDLLRL